MRDSREVKDLPHFRKYNQNNIIIPHLNINSLRSKNELLIEQRKGNVKILLISETKIDENFLDSQF